MALGSLSAFFILFIRNQVNCVSCCRDSLQNRKWKSKRNEVVNLLSAMMLAWLSCFLASFLWGKAPQTGPSSQAVSKSWLTQWQLVKHVTPGLSLATRAAQGQHLSLTCAGSTISARRAMKTSRSNQGNEVMVTAWSQPQGQLIQALLRQIFIYSSLSKAALHTNTHTHTPVQWLTVS